MKEPEIKLFGQKIVLPENGGAVVSGECSGQSNSRSGGGGEEVREGGGEAHHEKQLHAQEDQEAEGCETTMQEKDHNVGAEEPRNPSASLESDEDPKTPTGDEDAVSESSNPKSGKPALKKPDKILPCPRCNSMDTKFCYYNNYNVNQPRHFCKSCQRYWTSGGTMRNVPVGAGRRKNKNPASHCRPISISEALQAAVARVDVPSGFHNPTLGPNGSIVSFGPDSPLCESMASAMNLSDKRVQNGVRNGSGMKSEKGVYCQKGDSRDDFSMRSSSMLEGCNNGPQQLVMPNINGAPYPIPCIPGVAWPVPWNPAMPFPAICPSGYPVPVYPAPYWNCGVANPWNVPWVSTPPPVAANQKASGSGPNSPLGKHSRNGELLKPSDSPGLETSELKDPESSILVPKTLRIDDPHEAAKSSIWQTLGIKYDSVSREGLFKALQSKGDDKKHTISASPVMQANPAALSRSMTFQEGT